MSKATVTYKAPEGDNEVVHFKGVRFFDGEPVELEQGDNKHLFAKARNNPHFEVVGAEDDPDEEKPRRGRPPKIKSEEPPVLIPGPKPGEE